jgi:hypothetical protein
LPLRFERNEGQVDEQVHYLARGPGYAMFVTPTAMVLSLRKGAERPRAPRFLPNEMPLNMITASVLRVRLLKGRSDAQVEGLEELPGKSNYFIGNDPKKWRTNVASFAKVRCRGVYPGIDLVYYGNQGQLEYDFVVAPGADPRRIRLGFEGGRGLRLDGEGNLVVSLEGGELIQRAPRVYQGLASEKKAVPGRWVLRGRTEAGFQVGAYDQRQALIIDPVLSYSTYLGGNSLDIDESGIREAPMIAVDGQGCAYLTGLTFSTDFPTQDPYQADQPFTDAFVTKLSPSGDSLVYSTYLGGDGEDFGRGIAVDETGSAYVVGFTSSSDFPSQTPFQNDQPGLDGFVTKLSPAGDGLSYSTYLGGADADYGLAIAVDSTGSAYVTGATNSTDFPTKSPHQGYRGGQDAFATKLSATGNSLVYSTYLGGSDVEWSLGVAVDGSGSAYVTGQTRSSDFPTQTPFQTDQLDSDAFLTKLSPAGDSLAYSTYLGGSNFDAARGLTVDNVGCAYVTGLTSSTDFPTQNPFQGVLAVLDGFVTKVTPSGTSLVYSTYLGGSQGDGGAAIAVDSGGNAYVTGTTSSPDFPTRDPYHMDQPGEDAFVTTLSSSGNTLMYSTYLGGDGSDAGWGIAVDSRRNAYVAGATASTDFPTLNQYQTDQPAIDAFVTKLTAPSMDLFALAPCRVIDTRNAAGDLGGPALNAAADRTFTLVGPCDIPPTARAVAVNIAVTAPTKAGYLQLYPAGTAPPSTSSINYSAGQTRGNNAVVTLNTSGAVTVHCVQASGTTHFILDVTGYFK